MSIFRRLSSRGLAALIGSVAAIAAVGAAVAVTALGSGGSTPAPEPLSTAVHSALSAARVDGITARIAFTNHLLGSSALGSLGAGSPLLSGATGRLWSTSDGHLRLELQSDSGDAQIVSDGTTLSIYDASSNTAYRIALPARPSASTSAGTVPSLDQIESALSRLAAFADLSVATPDSIAGQPAYTVTASPKTGGGLVGSAALSWDAATGVPLRLSIYARGDSSPVLELTATDISYGTVPSSDVDIAPPAGAKLVTLSIPSGSSQAGSAAPVTGLDAVAAALAFKLVAPDTLDGLARSEVRLIGKGSDPGALVTYGQGLGTIVAVEHAAGSSGAASPLDQLPSVTIGGAKGHELVTALGTVVEVTTGGVSYAVGGSVAQADAEAAVRALTS